MTRPVDLTARQLNRTTLLRQSLLARAAEDPATAIHRLAGLQAQYPNSPYIALWSRLRDFRIEDLEAALDARRVVKASTIRATLHLVAAEDFPAFNVASAAARVANWRASAERAGLRTADLNRRLLRFAHEPRTIPEMEADLEALASDASLAPYVARGVRHTAFYLGAYGPASVADAGRWIGQPRLALVREAVARLGDRIRRFRAPDGRELVDLRDAPLATGDEPAPGRFLARWDSVIIGYEGRDRILPPHLVGQVIRRRNDDFLPSFTVDGLVAGTWAVSGDAGATVLEIAPGAAIPNAATAELTEEAEGLARFIGRDSARHEVRRATPPD